MEYSDFKALSIQDLFKKLKNVKRNNILTILQDYYDSFQWSIDVSNNSQTRFSRSGKEMWKPLDSKDPSKGFTAGELKVWNIIRAAIDIYARYTRGDDNEDIEIVISNGTTIDVNLTDIASELFEKGLNEWVMQAIKEMSIHSVICLKYTDLDNKIDQEVENNEVEVLKTLNLSNQDITTGMIESIDPREIEPIYWKGKIRGIIRFYNISANEAKLQGVEINKKSNNNLYIETWIINDNAKLEFNSYVEEKSVKSNLSPYSFLPFVWQTNSKHPVTDFDLEHIEVSDVDDLTDLQDDLNAFLTDWGIINRQVAIPMLKLTDQFVQNASTKDYNKIKENLSRISTYAGQILFGPFEKMQSSGAAPTHIQYLQDLLEQYYRQTGIPSSVFNSNGLAQIATETLDHLFESLKKVIGDKRTKVSSVIKTAVEMHLISKNLYKPGITIEVKYPDMFSLTKAGTSVILANAAQNGDLPSDYISRKYIEILGDSENEDEIMSEKDDEKIEQNTVMKQRMNMLTAKKQSPTLTIPLSNTRLTNSNNDNSSNSTTTQIVGATNT